MVGDDVFILSLLVPNKSAARNDDNLFWFYAKQRGKVVGAKVCLACTTTRDYNVECAEFEMVLCNNVRNEHVATSFHGIRRVV